MRFGVRLDSRRASGKAFKINLITPDVDEQFVVELSNGTLTNIAGFQAGDADLTITINRSDLERTMMGAVSFDDQINSGRRSSRATANPTISSRPCWCTSILASRSCLE
jgi:alkyl sulfatase BDS1-like metallo-beta-lactamase superfamily hydrolase